MDNSWKGLYFCLPEGENKSWNETWLRLKKGRKRYRQVREDKGAAWNCVFCVTVSQEEYEKRPVRAKRLQQTHKLIFLVIFMFFCNTD